MSTISTNEPRESALTVGELIRSLLSGEVAGMIRNDPIARIGDEPEGVHQLRVCARRLRSELRVVSPALKPAPTRQLLRELKWLGGALGTQRDLDVLVTVLTSAFSSVGVPAVSSLDRLEQHRVEELEKGRELLNSKRYRRLIRELAVSVVDPPLLVAADEPAVELVLPGLTQALRSLYAVVDGYGPDPTYTELHQIRIVTKRARYAAAVAAPLLGKTATDIARALEEVQTVLGDLHDRVVAIEYLHAHMGGDRDDVSTREHVGQATISLQHSISTLATKWRDPFARARVEGGSLPKPRLHPA
jgi:CHAD domain-containing protein